MGPGRRIRDWLNDRLALGRLWHALARHKVPYDTTTHRHGWMYVLGFVAAGLFALQLLTGMALLTRYVPASGSAYESIAILTREGWSGRLVRAMHWWGASIMVVIVIIHAIRVFLTGSYKFPREANWLSGVLLLGLVIAMAFTGQLLRWDQDGLWGVVVASQYAGRVPLVGDLLQRLILAGETVGGATLNRFFALHVFIMPLLILGLIGVHLALVQFHGISEPPRAGEPVEKGSYREKYQALLERSGRPYWPDAAWQELVAVGLVVAVVLALAVFAGPRPLGEPPDPASVPSHPRPDWFLMWYYALLAVKPRGFEDAVMVYLPIVAFLVLVLLPFVRSTGERAPSRRPVSTALVLVIALVMGTLTLVGYRGGWVPDFQTEPFTATDLGDVEPDVVRGGEVYFAKGCQYCHAVHGRGGVWGPDLTRVSARVSPGVISDRVLNGIGDMPAYRGELTSAELDAILTFLAAMARVESLEVDP